MPSLHRRSFLKAAGITGTSISVAGCSEIGSTESSESLPAGSLTFHNDDSVPHEISVEVLNVGTMRGERRDGQYTVTGTPDVAVSQQNLTATVILEPGENGLMNPSSKSEVWYDIRFTLDDKYPGEDSARTIFKPVRPNAETTGRTLTGRVWDGGEFSWAIGPNNP